MLTEGFYWSLSGIFVSLFSTLFLRNDLKNGRTYAIIERIINEAATIGRKVTIRRDQSPLRFKIKVWGTAICTALTFVICLLVLLVAIASSKDLLNEMHRWQVIAAFVPYSLVLLYVLESTSIRVFVKSWNREVESPQTLGLSGDDKRDEANDEFL